MNTFEKNVKVIFIITFFVIAALLFIYCLFIQFDNNDSTTLQREEITISDEKDKSKNIEVSNSLLLNNKNSNESDPSLNELIKEDTKIESQRLEAMKKVPPHEWQNNLITNMKNEDIKQTIENLANFDDAMLATSSINVVGPCKQSILVTRLMRVRKLYAVGRENPGLVIPELSRAQKDSFEKWPEALNKWKEDYENHHYSYSEPYERMRVEYSCLVATYLLAEFDNYDSLPQLSKQYKIHHVWPPPDILPSPVAPYITFYAMHRLVSSYPKASLSKEASQAIDEYLEAAKGIVPEPTQIKVTLYDDAYSEFDQRLDIVGVRNQILEGHKSMDMPLYPSKFIDGTDMQDGNGMKSEKLDELFNKLDAFVQIVYPLEKNSSINL